MEIQRRKKVDLNPNITPLIDIVFLLLIFFMLSYHVAINPGIKLNLPKASKAQQHNEEDIIIFITKNEDIYINEDKVFFNEIRNRLEDAIGNSDKKSIIIKADEEIDLGLAVKIMDISKQAGAQGLVISTEANNNVK